MNLQGPMPQLRERERKNYRNQTQTKETIPYQNLYQTIILYTDLSTKNGFANMSHWSTYSGIRLKSKK